MLSTLSKLELIGIFVAVNSICLSTSNVAKFITISEPSSCSAKTSRSEGKSAFSSEANCITLLGRETDYFGFLKIVYMEDLSSNQFFCDLRICKCQAFALKPSTVHRMLHLSFSISVYYVLELNSVLPRMKSFTSTRQVDSIQSMEMNITLMVK